MKKLLLFMVSLFTSITYGQAPINNYFSVPNSQFAIVSQTVDQSATGANTTWNFGTLTQTGTNTDTFTTPTAGELTSYPGTTQVLTISDGATTNQVFSKLTGSVLSLTGASNPDFTLDYNTDNALVGTYPLTYGSPATNDAIAGNIMAQGQTEPYTGTISTEVDAHGTLSFSVIGQGTYSGNVTRIISQQSVSFLILGFFSGTATLTTYNYYKNTDGALVFRTTEGVINAPPIIENETFSTTEGLITNTLSVANNQLVGNNIKLYPNPVNETLYIKLVNDTQISETQIIDLSGREVLTVKGNQDTINLSALQSGLYLVKLNTTEGVFTRKILKE